MKKNHVLLIVLSIVLLYHKVPAQVTIFPTPVPDSARLFYIQRTPNTNTIVYELNYKSGKLDTEEPVHVYWIRYTEKAQRAELNYIQRVFAYGIKAKLISTDYYELHIVADKKRVLYLRKAINGLYYVYTVANGKQVRINRIFLQINGGSFWKPNVEYVQFEGTDLHTGKAVKEQVKI